MTSHRNNREPTNRVLGASFAAGWILPYESTPAAEACLRKILEGKLKMATTALWHDEMCNLTTTAIRRKRLDEPSADRALGLLQQIPIAIHDHHNQLWQRRMLILSRRFGVSAYDASYLELADRLQCPLLTNDQTLRKAANHLSLA
ncbi:MAG TPA: type II toxin-antitoxin system VapC family toxin [Kiritimatiellia bacterium]|nr:type II toxin-antitoxin system VapC family toxin [Kiritimatiellia bacterium]